MAVEELIVFELNYFVCVCAFPNSENLSGRVNLKDIFSGKIGIMIKLFLHEIF